MTIKFLKSLLVLLTVGIIAAFAFLWKSPTINWAYEKEIYRCIYEFPHEKQIIPSGPGDFHVHYVRHADKKCVNPHFPSIEITTTTFHNAWVQIVHTDADEPQYRAFIDSISSENVFPYYTKNHEFYDAPLWQYGLFYKPLRFWQGNAHAIVIDEARKTITWCGGVSWGYTLTYTHLYPKMIAPQALTIEDWKKDQDLLKPHLSGYTFLDSSRPLK